MDNLKFAGAYIELSLDRRLYDASMAAVRADLAKLPGVVTIAIAMDAKNFRSQIAALRADLAKLKSTPIQFAVQQVGGASGVAGAYRPRASRGSGSRSAEPNIDVPLHSLQVSGIKFADDQRAATEAAAKAYDARSDRAAKAADRIADHEAKANDRASRLAERRTEREAKEFDKRAERATRSADRIADREAKAAERAAERAQKQTEREAKEYDQRQERATKAADRKADMEAKSADRSAKAAQRQTEREAKEYDRRQDRATRAADRKADADARASDRAVQIAQRQTERESREYDKRQERATRAADRIADAQAKAAARAASAAKAASKQQLQSFVGGVGMGTGMPFSTNLAMAGGQLVGKSIQGTVEAMIAATHVSIELQSKFTDLQRVSGLTAAQIGVMKEQLFDLASSKANAASIDDIIELANVGGRMGVADKGGPEALLKFTEAMSQVKTVITDIPAEELANRMARVLNNFELGTEYAKGFGSAIVKMDAVSTATASDILDITTRISGVGRSAGVTIQEVIALSSALKDAGINNEVAGTAMSSIFSKMASGSKKFADEIGIDVVDFENAYRRGPIEALTLVINKLNEMDDTVAKIQFVKDLGISSDRQRSVLLNLSKALQLVGTRTADVASEFGSAKAITEGVALKADDTKASMERLNTAFKRLGDSLAKHFLEPLTNAIDLLADFGNLASKVNFAAVGKSALNAIPNPTGIPTPALAASAKAGWNIGQGLMQRAFGPAQAAAPPPAPLPQLPPRKVIPPVAKTVDADEFHEAQVASWGAIRQGVGQRLNIAQGRLGLAGNQIGGNFGRLGEALRGLKENADKNPSIRAGMLADVDRRQRQANIEIADDRHTFMGRGLAPRERREFLRRAGNGQDPTAKDMRRKDFATSLFRANERAEEFNAERANLQWSAGKGDRMAQVGLSGADIGRRIQEDLLNGNKDTGKEQVKRLEEVVKILTQIKEAGGKGVVGAIGALLKGPG